MAMVCQWGTLGGDQDGGEEGGRRAYCGRGRGGGCGRERRRREVLLMVEHSTGDASAIHPP